MSNSSNSISPMSASDERKLQKLAMAVIDTVKAGHDPTEALTKVAREADINPEHVRRVAEAYNTSRTLFHLSEKTGAARLDSFPIANADEALKQLFPSKYSLPNQEKAARFTAAQCEMESAIKPESLIAKLAYQEKTAGIDITVKSVSSSADPDPQREYVRALNQAKRAEQIVKTAQENKRIAGHRMVDVLEKAAQEIRQVSYKTPFADIERALHMRYGVLAPDLCDLLYSASKGASLKQARATEIYPVAMDTRNSLFNVIDEFVATTKQFHKAAAVAGEVSRKAEPFRDRLKQQQEQVKTAAMDMTQSTVKNIFGGVQNMGQSDAYQKNLSKAYHQVQDPNFRDQMLGIKAKALLSELMGTDEVISTYDPEEVMDRYNELARLSPSVAQQPMMVRTILRRSLQQGQIDPFEANQYVSTGKALTEQSRIGSQETDQLQADPDLSPTR